MKTYNQTNFFKHTFCEFQQVDNFDFPENTNYKSKSESSYFYTDEGVYRKSNHWGKVSNCRWSLKTKKHYKNQNTVIGFANWSDFYPINSSEKLFFISVDFDKKLVTVKASKNKKKKHVITLTKALKKKKQINNLFKNDSWTAYYTLEKDKLLKELVTAFINSNKSLQEIKKGFIHH